jgi:hypothetical protein
VLRPVSAEESVPDDVERLTSSLRSAAQAPIIGRPRPAPRKQEKRRDAPLGDLDELEDELFADDELDDFPDRPVVGPRIRMQGETESAKLEYWTVRAQVYTTEVAAKLGVLAGLFGLSGKRATAGAMHEAKRFRRERIPESGRSCEVGVAVRLIVATTEWKVDAEITVPNLAAAAQLNWDVGDARIGIEVAGYSGPLGALLPAPRQLDVSTLVDYVSAFHEIQAQVFGKIGLAFLTPTVLNYEDEEEK